MENTKVQIEYLHNSCTNTVAYKIVTIDIVNSKSYSYISPFIYNNTDDAYIAACIELSNR